MIEKNDGDKSINQNLLWNKRVKKLSVIFPLKNDGAKFYL